jgi:hypothetical protein
VVTFTNPSESSQFDLDWTKKQWDLREAFEIPAPISVTWTVESDPRGSFSDLQRLGAEVGDKPDHPQRNEMERLERALADGGTITTYEICYRGKNEFRVSSTMPESGLIDYNDVVVKPDGTVWRMTDRSLHLYDTDRIPEGERPEDRVESLYNFLQYAMWGGMGDGLGDRAPVSVSVNGTSWTCEVASEGSGRRWRLSGEIVAAPGGERSLRVHESLVVEDDGRFLGASIRFSDYRPSAYFDRELAHRIEWVKPDGDMRQVAQFVSFGDCTEPEFAELSRDPTPEGSDAIRGTTAYGTIYDSRGSGTVLTGLDGALIDTLEGNSDRPVDRGWVVVVAVGGIGFFLLLFVRRRMSHS